VPTTYHILHDFTEKSRAFLQYSQTINIRNVQFTEWKKISENAGRIFVLRERTHRFCLVSGDEDPACGNAGIVKKYQIRATGFMKIDRNAENGEGRGRD
jgi:hypothetical protein